MKQTARKIIAILLTVAMIQGTGGLFSFATTADASQAADGVQPNAVSEETVAAGDSEAEALGQDFESAEEQQEADSDTEQQNADADAEQQDADADTEQQNAEPAEEMTYQYSDRQIEVTAVASDADAIPDGAKLVVTPVTAKSQGYSYDAYMNALNAKAGEGKAYTDRNTLLYDIAFMDGSREIQPASGTVDIKVNFKKDQLSKSLGAKAESDVQILHLPIKEGAAESAKSTKAATKLKASDVLVENVDADVAMGKTQTAEFEAESFSVWAWTGGPANTITIPETEGTFGPQAPQYEINGSFGELANFGVVGFSEIESANKKSRAF